MIATLLFPDLPALALQRAMGTRKQVLVCSGHHVVSPSELAGLPVERARALRPQACPFTRQPALERAMWERIVEDVFAFTPYIAEMGMGRLFCSPDNLPALRRLMDVTHACVGIAPTRTLSYCAALQARPGGMVCVDADQTNTFLEELPADVLLRIPELELDAEIPNRLTLFGLTSIGRVRRLSRSQFTAQFADAGIRIYDFLQTLTDANPLPLHVPPPVVDVTVPAWEATREPLHLETMLHEALAQAMVLLGAQRTGRAEVSFLDEANRTLCTVSRILRAPTADPRHLLVQTQAMMRSLAPVDAMALRLRLGALSIIPPTQTMLFKHSPTNSEVNAPMSRRFPQAIKRVTVLDANAYLPDRFARIEPWRKTS